MKGIIITLSVFIGCTNPLAACFNNYFTLDKKGQFHIEDDQRTAFNKNFNKDLNVQRLQRLYAKLQKEHDYKYLSDYALCLAKLGKANEALELLKELYKHYPNEYRLAANLGTAYELCGQVDSALKYIKRDMALNLNDHLGSEWVHVKVLETKLELKKNPDYLTGHTVLQLTEKQKNDSAVFHQLNLQVRERFPFTQGPDAIMASLLTDLGDISANVQSIEFAKVCYQVAKKYYGDKSPALDDKISTVQQLMKKYAAKEVMTTPIEADATNIKTGYISYEHMLDNNDTKHYTINWARINTNTGSLLQLVDFRKKPD